MAMKPRTTIPIWFFIGISLLVNGIIIFGASLYQVVQSPPMEARVVLFELHAGVWWGAILTLLGAFYCWHFAPSREDPTGR
jgi:hypothetical protein